MIPRKLHFIYISTPAKGGLPFYFCYWAAVRSAIRCNPGYEVNLWYEEEPRSPYFARLAQDIRLRKVRPPDEVFGNPVPHYAHKADVLRLQILLEEGGIYLDLDTVTVRPFESLLQHDVVMSLVKNDGKVFGLGNSVIMASPASSFMKRWYESYRTFRSRGHDEFYDEHGAGYSYRLAREHQSEITLLDETAFLTPDMTPRGIASLFLSDASYPNAFCHHLWGKNAQDVIESLNEWNVALYPGLYSRQVQAVIGDEIKVLRDTGGGCSPMSLVPVVPRYASVHVSSIHEMQRRFVNAVMHATAACDGMGIVTTIRRDDFATAWILLSEFGRLGVSMPVEAWSVEGELGPEQQAALSAIYPQLRIRIFVGSVAAEALKFQALCYSAFKEILWLDTDCFPLHDPRHFFDDARFRATGSLFWLHAGGDSRADVSGAGAEEWRLYGIPATDCPPLSPSVFLVDKSKCLPQLLLALFVNRNLHLYEQFRGKQAAVAGALRFAWQYVQFMKDGALRQAGYLTEAEYPPFGFILQPKPSGDATSSSGVGAASGAGLFRGRDARAAFITGAVRYDASQGSVVVEPDVPYRLLYERHLGVLSNGTGQ